MNRAFLSFLILGLALAAGTVLGPRFAGDRGASAQTPATNAGASRQVPGTQGEIQLSFAPLVREAAPAVVNVYSSRTVQQRVSPFAGDPFFEEFFGRGQSRPRVQGSLGSGVIVAPDGVIVTNAHVVKGTESLRVVLADRREFDAELVLADERTDLAVLRIDAGEEALPTLDFADTRSLEVGDLVLAIGNPFGIGQTVTSGIISATARTDVGITDYAFFLQTDAAINPGNSGGALINTEGQLVGVNTAIYSRSGGSNGIGFSIPSEMVKRVVDSAINDGRVIRPWLGLKGEAVTADIAESLGLDRPVGVVVTEIYPEGPAEAARLRKGDIILAIDDREVFDEGGLKFLAAIESPGEAVALRVRRAGVLEDVTLVLEAPPGATEAELILLSGNTPFNGVEVADISPALAEEIGRDPFSEGVLVTRMMRRSLGWRLGLRPGDLVLAVNGEAIETVGDLEAKLEEDDGSSTWQLSLDRNGQRATITRRFY